MIAGWRPGFGGLLLVVITPLAYAVGLATGLRLLVPVLIALPAWLVMVTSLRAMRPRRAVSDMLVWAVTLGVVATVGPVLQPELAEAGILNGARYRAEMFEWLETGDGAEAEPRLFLPLHAAHLALFVVVGVASGSLAAMVLGAALMNYMGYYVAGLVSLSSDPYLVGLLGWHPWSVMRVLAYVILGVVLAEALVRRGALGTLRWPLVGTVAVLLFADVTVKWLLASQWRLLLLSYLP